MRWICIGCLMVAMSLTAASFDSTQVFSASIETRIDVQWPTGSIDFGAVTNGLFQTDTYSLIVESNVAYQIVIETDSVYMRQWDGSSYVPAGHRLTNPLEMSLDDGSSWNSVSSGHVVGEGGVTTSGTRTHTVKYRQGVEYPNDHPLPSGHTYRLVITYTAIPQL